MLGKILIANPSLEDIRFQSAVILICESTDDVVMGLILNKPLQNFDVGQLLKIMKLGENSNKVKENVFFGGPVHTNQGFIVHSENKNNSNSECIFEDIHISSSNEVFVNIINDEYFLHSKIFLGCAVWDKIQLDNEILDNSWIISDATKDLIFYNNDNDLHLWNKSLKLIGVDPLKLINYSGKA